jgi:hypothetical protein
VPRTVTSITVFLASPGDVESERDIISKSILEWNTLNSRQRQVYFDLLRWETSVSAGFSSDGQAVVNEQIGDAYDVLIAIFWSRLGTATPRAASGTIEENERALGRYQAGENIELAFFFKDAPLNFRQADLVQLQAVKSFESQVQQAGAFSKMFKDEDALKFEVSLLLGKIARKYDKAASDVSGLDSKKPEISGSSSSVQSDIEEDDVGFYDMPERLTKHTSAATKSLSDMNENLMAMSLSVGEIVEELSEIRKLRPIAPSEAKHYAERVACGMDEYSAYLEANLSEFAEQQALMATDIRRLIDLSYDFAPAHGTTELTTLDNTLEVMISGMSGNITKTSSFLKTIIGLQRTTSLFNKARRRLVSNLNGLISAMTSSRNLVIQGRAELQALIKHVQKL